MTDSRIKTGVAFVRNGLWQIMIEGTDYVLTDQWPDHPKLTFGRDENCRIKVKILKKSTEAELLEVLR